MKKYFKTALLFLKINLQTDLFYRFDAFFTFVTSFVFMMTFIWSLRFTFDKVPLIRGYGYDQLFVFVVLGQLWFFLVYMFAYRNFQFMANLINKGTLDIYLLKPLDLRKLTPFLKFNFRTLAPIVLAVVLILGKIDIFTLSLWQILGVAFFFLNGVLTTYFITSIFISLNFWTGRNDAVFKVLFELPRLITTPIDFFPFLVKEFFIFVIPVAVMINPSFQIIYGKADPFLLIWSLALTVITYIISIIVWKMGLKQYTSAN